jgi:Iap family predicted aminopeptidase
MINKISVIVLFITLSSCNNNSVINKKLIDKHLITLSSDEMKGRRAGSEGIEKATKYIESEFERIGLSKFDTLNSYRQNFELYGMSLNNVVGVLKGKSLSDEYVLVTAHYDHLGIDTEKQGDNIYNGANDNASGVTAVLVLAEYFKKSDVNERNIVFIAFTGEEMGLRGSRYFGKNINPDNIIAGINIEMIGVQSKYGKNTAWLTGFDKSDFGEIIQKNLSDTKYKIFGDPYPKQNLFFRSDNAALARLGIPAHTFSTTPMGKDSHYHKVTDEYKNLDVLTIKESIELISKGILSIIQGEDTPTRIYIK